MYKFLLSAVTIALVVFGASAPVATADNITVNGVEYSDVLIYVGDSMYYVKIPEEGRLFNVPIEAIKPSQIRIVEDPYYRDELKRRYKESASGDRRTRKNSSGPSASIDMSSLSLIEPVGEVGVSALSVGGEGGGAGISRAQLEQMLTGFGLQAVESNASSATLRMPDGSTTIELFGPPESLQAMKTRMVAPEAGAQMLKASLAMSANMMQASAPWLAQWLTQNAALIDQGGTAQKSQDGLTVLLTVTRSDGNITLESSYTF